MDIRESEFGITQDVTGTDVKRFGSCERVHFADAVDVIVECFLEESPSLVSSILTGLVLLAFAPRTPPGGSLWGFSGSSDLHFR